MLYIVSQNRSYYTLDHSVKFQQDICKALFVVKARIWRDYCMRTIRIKFITSIRVHKKCVCVSLNTHQSYVTHRYICLRSQNVYILSPVKIRSRFNYARSSVRLLKAG